MPETLAAIDVAEQHDELSKDELAEYIGDLGYSMALDNGHDIYDEDAEEHADEHWHSYVIHALEHYKDELRYVGNEQRAETLDDEYIIASAVRQQAEVLHE